MRTNLTWGLAIGFFLTGNANGSALAEKHNSANGEKQITIFVYDFAQAEAKVLRKAEQAAADIFAKAGTSTIWVECPASDSAPRNSDCTNIVGPLKLILHVVRSSGAGSLRPNSDVFGISALGDHGEFGCDAWVFFDLIKDAALQERLSLPQILGSLIAHELGHLLLGPNSHSRDGLMRGRWPRAQLLMADCGELQFSDAERRTIQKAILVRGEAASTLTANNPPAQQQVDHP